MPDPMLDPGLPALKTSICRKNMLAVLHSLQPVKLCKIHIAHAMRSKVTALINKACQHNHIKAAMKEKAHSCFPVGPKGLWMRQLFTSSVYHLLSFKPASQIVRIFML